MAPRTVDPLFAAYAKTAPLGDLRWSLAYATRRLVEYDLPARTVAIIGAMRQLETQLVGRDGTSADRTRVHALIDRFKGSVPDWAGSPWHYGRALDHLIRKATAHGVSPVAIARLRAWYVGHLPVDADPFGRCLPRLAPLTPDEVHAVLQAVVPAPSPTIQAVAKSSPRVTHAVSGIACPTPRCRGTLATGDAGRVTCPTCTKGWTLVPVGFFDRKPAEVFVRKPEVSRKHPGVSRKVLAGGKAAVDWRAAGLKAAETRRRNLAARLAAEQAAA